MMSTISVDDVLHQQIDMLVRMDNPRFRQLLHDTLQNGMVNVDTFGSYVADNVTAALADATPYRVRADVMPLITAAARAYRDDDLTRETPPTRCGFARFEEPLEVYDVHGVRMLGHVATWGPARVRFTDKIVTGTFVVLWNDLNTEPDHYAREMFRVFGEDEVRGLHGRWSTIGATVLIPNVQIGGQMLSSEISDGTMAELTNTFRLLNAFFDMLTQRIVLTGDETPHRSARKRAARAGLREASAVRTVTLRRRSREGAGSEERTEGDVQWSCRWVVAGHWHRYRVGAGRERVERRWVEAYIKGPDDAPLRPKLTVYDLRR